MTNDREERETDSFIRLCVMNLEWRKRNSSWFCMRVGREELEDEDDKIGTTLLPEDLFLEGAISSIGAGSISGRGGVTTASANYHGDVG